MGVCEDKGTLRAHMRHIRDAVTASARKQAEDELTERLYNLPGIRKAHVIGVYQAIGSEISIAKLVQALRKLEDGPTIVYPAVWGKGIMQFVPVSAGETPAFLRNPAASVNPAECAKHVEPDDIDVLLVPGLAFDKRCQRLGQGGGYYDRFLERVNSDCLTVGVAFDEQIVKTVPFDVHDRRVDYVVTPTRTLAR